MEGECSRDGETQRVSHVMGQLGQRAGMEVAGWGNQDGWTLWLHH